MEQPGTALIVRHLPRMRSILKWFEPWLTPNGLLGKNPQWNFIDWAGPPGNNRETFPSYGKDGGSCLMTVTWLGTLRQGAVLEAAYGDKAEAAADTAKADAARDAIRRSLLGRQKRALCRYLGLGALEPAYECAGDLV